MTGSVTAVCVADAPPLPHNELTQFLGLSAACAGSVLYIKQGSVA